MSLLNDWTPFHASCTAGTYAGGKLGLRTRIRAFFECRIRVFFESRIRIELGRAKNLGWGKTNDSF